MYVRFNEGSKGQLAKLRAEALRHFSKGGRTVWLDVQKNVSELQPGRLVRRACEILTLFKTYKTIARKMESNLRDMSISGDSVVMVNARVKPCWWTKPGIERYSEEERRQVAEVLQG